MSVARTMCSNTSLNFGEIEKKKKKKEKEERENELSSWREAKGREKYELKAQDKHVELAELLF